MFTNSATLMRNWIAKLISIIDHLINETNEDKNISFGSEDISLANQTFDGDFDALDTNKIVYMYK